MAACEHQLHSQLTGHFATPQYTKYDTRGMTYRNKLTEESVLFSRPFYNFRCCGLQAEYLKTTRQQKEN